MRLRTRVFLLVATAALLSGLIAFFAVNHLLLNSFLALERETARADAVRARELLLNGNGGLIESGADWANWDALHAALAGDAESFAAEHLVPVSLTSLRVSRIVLLTRDARVLQVVDASQGRIRDLNEEDTQALLQLQHALRLSGGGQLSGYWRNRAGDLEQVVISAVYPVSQRADSLGDVVLVRRVDGEFLQGISRVLQSDVALFEAGYADGGGETVWVQSDAADAVWGWLQLPGVFGDVVAVGRVEMPRDKFAQARETMQLIGLVILVICLLAPVLAELAIDRLVVARIRGLRDWAQAVAGGGDLKVPVDIRGSDEVSDLANSVSAMADHLHGVQQELETARERADRASSAKSQFLAGASHEIRTPLTAILGYAELLQERNIPAEEYFHYLGTIRSNGQDLLDILNDILDLSKVEAGRLDLSWEKTDICALVASVVSLLNVKAAAKHLELTAECATYMPAWCLIDPMRFRQILVNLIGNAIRYTDQGSVQVSGAVEQADTANAQLRIAVRDTGVGMPAGQVAQLFRPFTQVGSVTRRQGGTGLGLALSQEFARAMGGAITVQSEPGKGSVFTLTLPIGDLRDVPPAKHGAISAHADDEEEDGQGDLLPGRRVLLVEDNAVNRMLVEKLLERIAVDVSSVHDGAQALARLLDEKHVCDLVLLDMHLPLVDGYSVVRRLRAAGYSGPVVALTASAMAGERERALTAGCNDFIAKPLQARSFLRTCRQWLQAPAG